MFTRFICTTEWLIEFGGALNDKDLLEKIDKNKIIAEAKLSSLISKVVVVCSVALSIFILNIGVALWVGALLGKAYYGFFVVAGVYALLSILFSVYRHKVIKHPISNALITKILK